MSFIKPHKFLFALVDCNNFFASCERVFNPKLHQKPIVVLSSNDGCIIARSNEAKALGIPMGAPAFLYEDLFKRSGVEVFSSNFSLYGEMSQRVMQTLTQFSPEMEIYSIDEAFLSLHDSPSLSSEAQNIKSIVQQWTGIPISLGIAPTKTLAKVANKYAKKHKKEGFCILKEENDIRVILSHFPVEDVWGVGRQTAQLLVRNGIRNAWDLACMDDCWVRKRLSVTGLRMIWELRGISCLSLDDAPISKRSIISSRSFGKEITKEEDLAEALSEYVSSAATRLRRQNGVATYLEVFLHTNKHKNQDNFYFNSIQVHLPEPSNFTPLLIQYAKFGLQKIYRDDLFYKKIGVMLGGLISTQSVQQDLFRESRVNFQKQQKLMQIMDETNAKLGKNTLQFAAQGIKKFWKSKHEKKSSHFTTAWDEILTIRI